MQRLAHPTRAGFVLASEHYPSAQVDDIIRSLRVKLFRERAKLHKLESRLIAARYASWASEEPIRRHEKAVVRFSRIADKIERGEL